MEKIIVIGHENPDTDSIAAAVGIVELLKKEGLDAQAVKAGINKETEWALNYCQKEVEDLENISLENTKVFFVDFNEEAQNPIKEKVDLYGLIDHHKLASSFASDEPILFRIEPLGSTSTLVAKMFKEKEYELDESLAKLLLLGIISDTLNLTSPTTTEEDKKIVDELAEKTNKDVQKLADNLFEAKSDLSSFTPKEIAKLDYKNFEFKGQKVGIGVIETVKPEKLESMEQDLRTAILEIKKEENLNYVYLGIVDIIKQNTKLIIIGDTEKELAQKAFPKGQTEGMNMILNKVVSRKKQIAPAIEKAIK